MSTDTVSTANDDEAAADATTGPDEVGTGTTETTTTEPTEPAEKTEPTETAETAARPPSARPLTAALLNLSGFGLGYLHLRAWIRLVAARAATAGLAWVALPIGREPISVWWAVGYLGVLALLALDAAHLARRRARRETPHRTVWTPRAARRVAWATLAVVPLLGAAYVVTQHEVLEQHLAYDLDRATERLGSTGHVFAPHQDVYDATYATYVRTAAEHPRTRAADRVPGLVDDLYAQAKADDVCNALDAVRHFAKPGTAGPLRAVAQEELPGTLRDCGTRHLERGNFSSARPALADLLADHPASEPAQALPGELAAWRDDKIKGLGVKGGCTDTTHAVASTSFLAGFDSGKVSALADKTRTQVPTGLLRCAVQQFEREQYTMALDNVDALLDTYPRATQADYAERLRIATGMAMVEPEAGVGLPARAEPEGTVTLTVYNYSPEPIEVLYAGPATGSLTIDACEDCTYYAKGDAPECIGYSLTVPSAKVTIPAGDYLTATRDDGIVRGWDDKGLDEGDFTHDSGFCTWSHKP